MIDQSDGFNNQDSDKQFSDNVIEYQKQIENIIAWMFKKEEELQQRSPESILQNASTGQVLVEYSWTEEFIKDFFEYCSTIMNCHRDAGIEMRDRGDMLTDEDRDEIDIQMDTMTVFHERLKIRAIDRLRSIQKIVEDRQQTKLEQIEEWLSSIEMKIASSNNIGPDYPAIQRQLKDMDNLKAELEQKQDILNFVSNFIVFDEVDSDTLTIRKRSCESIDDRLEKINHKWEEVCLFVNDRCNRLRNAESIWKILNMESPQLINWLRKVEKNLFELDEATKSLQDIKSDPQFFEKLLSRSSKIDSEIKSKQSFYTSLENRVRIEIDKFDDPCSMLVIELEKRLEDLQDNWNAIGNRKRVLDFKLQALSDPSPAARVNMIPLPDPITSSTGVQSEADRNFVWSKSIEHTVRDHFDDLSINSPPSANDMESYRQINDYNDPRVFDNSLSSDTKSMLHGNSVERDASSGDESQEDLEGLRISRKMVAKMQTNNLSKMVASMQNDNSTSPEMISTLSQGTCNDDTHNCRVVEWKISLESFTSWLKGAEIKLGVDHGLEAVDEHVRNWTQLDLDEQLLLITEIDNQIISTCQAEFDCLMLQGQQILEDLEPEIDENDSEELKEILSDVGSRYSTVRKCLDERKQGLSNKDRWFQLLEKLKNSSRYLIDQMGLMIVENNIGVDLITLAQQQDQLMHAKVDLEENDMIQSSLQEAKLFLKFCDNLQQQHGQRHPALSLDNIEHGNSNCFNDDKFSNNDIWLSFKDLRDDIENQFDRLRLHYTELSQLIEDRLERLDEVHREMHALQHKMQDLATKLQVAEILKSKWVPLDNLTIEKLSEQLEDLKIFRERLSEIESTHRAMNSTLDWMAKSEVPLSHQNLGRIDDLNTIWGLMQASADDRQKLIEEAFDNQGASEQRFLAQTVSDLPRWERRVATSRVPYFVDHENNKTEWDHPKFSDLLKSMSSLEQFVFAAYRTAFKLRIVQNKLGIDLMMLEQLKEIISSSNLGFNHQGRPNGLTKLASNNNDTLLGVEQVIFFLKAVYERIQAEEKPNLDVPLSIDLTLNWLLNLHDSQRTGYISALSLKVSLTLICCATREEKYTYMYELIANQAGRVDARNLGTLFEICMRVPIYLGEGDSFGGAKIIETSIKNCFSVSKFNPQHPNSIDLADYLNWLKSEPQFIIWLPVLHRLHMSENIVHPVKCKLCSCQPIVGLRYRCLKSFKFNICQNCFLTGRHLKEHSDSANQPFQEYFCASSSGDNVRVFTKILRNKLKPKGLSRAESS